MKRKIARALTTMSFFLFYIRKAFGPMPLAPRLTRLKYLKLVVLKRKAWPIEINFTVYTVSDKADTST